MTSAVLVGLLAAGGTYLLLQRDLLQQLLGFLLLGHAVNLLLLASGGVHRRGPAFVGRSGAEPSADPLPQAFVLTAIVITFGIGLLLLALIARTEHLEDDPS